jgi:hypothetical protein
MVGDSTLRQRVLGMLSDVFGQPGDIRVGPNESFYRWLVVTSAGRSVYITLNCPDPVGEAHVLVSDPEDSAEPVRSLRLESIEDAEGAVALIRQRWPMAWRSAGVTRGTAESVHPGG